jgi:hypothetical protein
MTPDVMFNALLGACKKYIDSIFSGYTTETKELAAFEKENMARYSGGAAIDHVLFRKFLRLLNGMYSIDAYTKSDIDEMLEKKSDKADFTKYTISIVGKHGQQTITLASMQSDEPQSE